MMNARSFLLIWLGSCVLLSQAVENPIKHFIVLMMENRSFDHYLGWLKRINPEIDGLTGAEFACVEPGNMSSTCVYVNQNGNDEGPDDPGHSFDDTLQEIYGWKKPVEQSSIAKMNGFVWNADLLKHNLSNPMSMFTINSSSAAVLNTLALDYALFDRWYSSVPGPTDPNRAFAMSGTSNGATGNFNGTLWSQQSYFDFLTQHNVSWSAYYDEDPWAIVYFQDMKKAPNSQRVYSIDAFYQHLANATLPQFVWLQPSMITHASPPNWQHPDASVQWGEVLIQNVYEALRDSQYWNESALLITFDEHGGFYDHVAPPQTNVPPPDGVVADNGFAFDRLGIRVPTVLVSPWVTKGTVIHEPDTSHFDSTSNLATCNKLFGIADTISARQAWAATFDDLFTELRAPRTDAPTFDAPKKWTAEDLRRQQRKPLNEHLSGQVQFYCQQLNVDPCPQFDNQGDASEFIARMVPLFLKKN